MLNRYRAGLAVTSLFCFIAATPQRPAHTINAAQACVGDLYSKRALRRARTILQLQLLQMRAQRLQAVGDAVRRTLQSSRTWPPRSDKERLPFDLP